MMSEKQLREKIIELEKQLEIWKVVLNSPKDGKMGRPKGSTMYTPEQMKFLAECEEKKLSDKQIIEEFNKKYDTNIKPNGRQLYNLMQRQGIRKTGWRFKS
jgi:hypothetical protein